MQHVETIQVPRSWEQLKLNNWKDVSWEEKRFKVYEIKEIKIFKISTAGKDILFI